MVVNSSNKVSEWVKLTSNNITFYLEIQYLECSSVSLVFGMSQCIRTTQCV